MKSRAVHLSEQPFASSRPSLSKEVLTVTADKNGRFLIVNTIVDEDEFCLVNIYAPNDQNQQINFYQKITDSFS